MYVWKSWNEVGINISSGTHPFPSFTHCHFSYRGQISAKMFPAVQDQDGEQLAERRGSEGASQSLQPNWHWFCGSLALMGNFWGCKISLFALSSGWIQVSSHLKALHRSEVFFTDINTIISANRYKLQKISLLDFLTGICNMKLTLESKNFASKWQALHLFATMTTESWKCILPTSNTV